jgi:DNA-binding GntR family transcriptional regulator
MKKSTFDDAAINHKSLVEHIVEKIEQQIMDGALKPGERIVEAALCKKLNISRSPLREACRILESQGYVVRLPRKGVFVAQVSPQEAEDICRIRANLESLATYLAVKKMNPKALKEMKALHRRMIKLAKNGNVSEYYRLNLKFHKILTNACENKRLIQMIDTFVKQTGRYRVEVLSIPGRLKASIENHEKIIRSIERGDAEEAELLRKNTILNNIPILRDKLIEEGGQG